MIKLDKTDIQFLLGIMLTITAAIGSQWIESNKTYITIFLVVISVVILLLWLIKKHYGIIIINKDKGLNFITSELDSAMKEGGTILSTAIFEDVKNDAITEHIKVNEVKKDKELTFKRLVLLNNPSLEFLWIKDFLSLKTNNFTPIVYHIPAIKKPIIGKIIRSVPRFSISVFYNSNNLIKKIYLGFKGSESFGISISHKKTTNRIASFLNDYLDNSNKIEDFKSLPSSKEFNSILFDNIVTLFEDENFARKINDNDDILFIGAFGSSGLSLQKRVQGGKPEFNLDGDLDLVILLSNDSNLNEVKTEIEFRIHNEYDRLKQLIETDSEINIEFSNLDDEYYSFRTPVHIDIQLHKINKDNDYYSDRNKARLLGYSIFSDSFYTIYSKNNKCIQEHGIEIPSTPVDIDERVSLVLDSKNYGIVTASDRILDFKYKDTDPRRLFWIVVQNYVWAISGYRIHNKINLFKYIEKRMWFSSLNNITKNIITNIDSFKEDDFDKNKRKHIRELFLEIITDLQSCKK